MVILLQPTFLMSCVCKLWRESIVNDSRFIEAHYVESQKNPILMFNFLPKTLDGIVDCVRYQTNQLYYLQKDEFLMGKEKVIPYLHKLTVAENDHQKIRASDWSYFVMEIIKFSKLEKLRIVSRIHTPGKMWVQACRFGYDCLSNKYKLMCTLNHGDHASSRNYLILTLESGSDTQLWREIKNPPIPQGLYPIFIHCINEALYWWLSESFTYVRALLTFDLHEEKFQVIKLPNECNPHIFSEKKDVLLEYRKCPCVASIKESGVHSGVVELFILEDRSNQIWVKETMTFDIPITICPSAYRHKTTFSPGEDGINLACIRIIGFSGRIFLYWGKLLLHKRIRSRMIQFYDLQSRELKEVRVGSKCGSNYHVTNHVENLISLRAWATKEGDGGELGRNKDIDTVRTIEDMFKQMPPSPTAAISFFSSLSEKKH
ncbi:hypothetical protein MKX03_011200 [Papaver bracteatum]|nr:hypothetical protein MKX03_011200 [Papaver bracteatum]